MAVKEKRGLGTGLDALFGPETREYREGTVQSLPLSRIEPRPDQPRDRFDEALLQDLASSIARHGLIQPVIVRRLPNDDYQIIAGERRWRAARLAGLTEIPVRVLEADDQTVAELALVENLQREDLNPMEEARGYRKLITDYHLTQEEAAAGVGKSRSTVTNALRLLNLSGPVADLVESGALSAGHARALLSIADPDLQLSAANHVLEKNLSVRKTEQLAARLNKAGSDSPSLPRKRPLVDYAAELSEELSSLLGRRVSLREEKKNQGKIELYYDNADDRELLIEALRSIRRGEIKPERF
jgi:ParB family chromosome partitioning protein